MVWQDVLPLGVKLAGALEDLAVPPGGIDRSEKALSVELRFRARCLVAGVDVRVEVGDEEIGVIERRAFDVCNRAREVR